MNGKWQSQAKIDIARDLLNQSVDKLKGTENLELALRVYGHQSSIATAEQDCDDTELVVPFGRLRFEQIKKALNGISPKGTTPIARSLEKAAGDFPDNNARNIIILITDGVEACDEDPCAVSLALQRRGVVLKPFVIGIGADESMKFEFECIGNYYDAGSEETFEQVLNIVISQALNNTTVQVNLLNINDEPLETNIPMSFYDHQTGLLLYNYVHTLNHKNHPDTIPIDPVYVYDIVAHTIPEQRVEGERINAGTHTIIDIATPQGDLELVMDGRNAYKNLKCLIKDPETGNIIHVQDFNSTEKYIVGQYDLEILSLPRIQVNKVDITQNHTTDIAIPTPGVLNAAFPSAGYGTVMQVKGDQLTWVCQIDERDAQQQIVLQPGSYKLIYRSRNSKESIYTLTKDFKIKSGESSTVRF